MRLEVPFFKQTTLLNCGPTALRMVLAYLDRDYGIELLERKTEIQEGKGEYTIQIAMAAALLGYPTKFFSTSINFNPENLKLEFYQKYADTSDKVAEYLLKAKNAGVKIKEKSLSLDELLSYITKDSLPIVLLDINVINNKKGYQGHFVPAIGYDKDNVVIHQHGLKFNQPYQVINKEIFEKARKASGTDEDVVVVYKKK